VEFCYYLLTIEHSSTILPFDAVLSSFRQHHKTTHQGKKCIWALRFNHGRWILLSSSCYWSWLAMQCTCAAIIPVSYCVCAPWWSRTSAVAHMNFVIVFYVICITIYDYSLLNILHTFNNKCWKTDRIMIRLWKISRLKRFFTLRIQEISDNCLSFLQ
jgi:hypothetical protein